MTRSSRRVWLYPIVFLLLALQQSGAQQTSINYNTYYAFPVSFGAEYETLSPFNEYGANFNVFQLSGSLRIPFRFSPIFQPTIQGGMIKFDSLDAVEPLKWDHTYWYGAGGLTLATRFEKNFELAGDILAGYAYGVFPDLVPETGPVSTTAIYGQAGVRITLNPSYNFSIDIHPSIKYLYSLSSLADFNGPIFGLGFSAAYRFGEDPDAPAALIRSIKFGEAKIPPLFSAMQSYYAKNPFGKISIENSDKKPITNVEVSFFQPGFMDSPTKSASIDEIKPGEAKTVDLYAIFNQEVFRTEGITPLTGEVIVTYSAKGKAAEQRQSVTYDLHDKTALTWDDDRKAAAFITPADSALRNYTSFIRQACKSSVITSYPETVQTAAQVFHALGEIGILYQPDPTAPFASVKGDSLVVDSISLPRDTLSRITGDCDDLTVLYCSLLETVGIETAFITIPGHIFAAFNTKKPSRSYKEIHPERELTINLDGELWVPVEITMFGKASFLDAWRKASEEYRAFDTTPEKRGFFVTKKAQEVFRPVGLRETDLGLQYGNKDAIVRNFSRDMEKLSDTLIAEYLQAAKASGKKQDYNKLGIAYARFGQYSKAEESFKKAIEIDRSYLEAEINLGNVQYLKGQYDAAARAYDQVINNIRQRGGEKTSLLAKAYINSSKAYYAASRFEEANKSFEAARLIDEDSAKEFAYLGVPLSENKERAAEIQDPGIIFAEESEEEGMQ